MYPDYVTIVMGCYTKPSAPLHDRYSAVTGCGGARASVSRSSEADVSETIPETRVDIDTVLTKSAIVTHFQPIVGLRDGISIGFEALSRGPVGSILESPRDLFATAEGAGRLPSLERACWQSALRMAAELFHGRSGWTNLFINVLPDQLRDDTFLDAIRAMMAAAHILPSQVVVEITEGSRIENYAVFRDIVTHYRRAGLRFAVDDAGAGHSGLQTITELIPDFVKIDKGLIRGIDRDVAKRAAVEALVGLTRRLGIGLVAEGIETAAELLEVRRLGVPCGQGYFLARPEQGIPTPSADALMVLRSAPVSGTIRRSRAESRAAIGDIVVATPGIATHSPVQTAYDEFGRQHCDGLVVVDAQRPMSLLMRAKLDRRLSQQYGREIYLRRPVDEVAELHPLIVDAQLSVDEVSRLAMERDDDNVYDHIIVAQDGAYMGTVSVRSLLETVTALRIASARMEHPLTGLPGSPAIREEINARMFAGESFGLLYIDLDNFKAFNDCYGFHHGDRAIRLLARILTEVCGELPNEPTFLSHVGGDDFIVITGVDTLRRFGDAVTRRFRDAIPALYKRSDRERGFIEATSRQGGVGRFPIMNVTVAMLEIAAGQRVEAATLVEWLAAEKAYAKQASRLVTAVA